MIANVNSQIACHHNISEDAQTCHEIEPLRSRLLRPGHGNHRFVVAIRSNLQLARFGRKREREKERNCGYHGRSSYAGIESIAERKARGNWAPKGADGLGNVEGIKPTRANPVTHYLAMTDS